MEVKSTLLDDFNEEDVYVEPPPSRFVDPTHLDYVFRLVKALFVVCNFVMTVDHLNFYDPRDLRTLIEEEKLWHDNHNSILGLCAH